MEYLFSDWNRLARKINNHKLFLFLDFDGTLAPIASVPEAVVLPVITRRILEKMSEHQNIKLAFISGRHLDDIKSKIKIKNAVYSGTHGLQLDAPGIKFKPLISSRHPMVIAKIKHVLQHKLFNIQGAMIEDKEISLSLHYRLVNKQETPLLKTIFNATVMPYLMENKIKIRRGKMVLEIMPPVKWDKGEVVLWLLEKGIGASTEKFLPVYIGDDVTDEDAFRTLKNKGVTVSVGNNEQSLARYYLKDHIEVQRFLEMILAVKEEKPFCGGVNYQIEAGQLNR